MVQLTNKHWAFELPSMAFGIMVNNYGDESELMYMLSMEDIADDPNHEETLITKKLPPGSWQFLFTTKEATEEQARTVVRSHYSRSAFFNADLGHYQTAGSSVTYMNYEEDRFSYKQAIKSLQSLLKSKGCDVNKNYCVIQKL